MTQAVQSRVILCLAEPELTETIAMMLPACEVVRTSDCNRALAWLFVDRRIEAVVFDAKVAQRSASDFLRSIKSVRRNVPVLVCLRHESGTWTCHDDCGHQYDGIEGVPILLDAALAKTLSAA